MKVLIIDNTIDRKSWGSPELARFGKLFPGATVYVRRAPEGDLPKTPYGFDRVIVSGSKTAAAEDAPWIFNLHQFILRTIDAGKPYLGVCYGHQSLVRALGGKETVRRAAEAEFGWTRIELLESSSGGLFEGLPPEFYSFSSHFDEVFNLPSGVKCLARSQRCQVQACQIEAKPVFGIQFHPEKNLPEAEATLLERKKLGIPKDLLHPKEGAHLYDPQVGEILFRNFLRL